MNNNSNKAKRYITGDYMNNVFGKNGILSTVGSLMCRQIRRKQNTIQLQGSNLYLLFELKNCGRHNTTRAKD